MLSLPVAVAVTVIGFSGKSLAGDEAAPVAAGPVVAASHSAGGCTHCSPKPSPAWLSKDHKSIFHHQKCCTPYQTTLCPGACFGYFQTQWHRWESVCPIPYQGVGLSDAPQRTPSSLPVIPKVGGSDGPIPNPKPVTPPGK